MKYITLLLLSLTGLVMKSPSRQNGFWIFQLLTPQGGVIAYELKIYDSRGALHPIKIMPSDGSGQVSIPDSIYDRLKDDSAAIYLRNEQELYFSTMLSKKPKLDYNTEVPFTWVILKDLVPKRNNQYYLIRVSRK